MDPELKIVQISESVRPILVTIVDAEEEFDWTQFRSTADSVSNIRHQTKTHSIFERYNVVPTYLIDYPVATKREGYEPLRELHCEGACEIGAQMHPWVNPPYEETLSRYNSYAGNLSKELEREKLRRLTAEIERRFDFSPIVYRAGRYGLGPNTASILHELGYRVDMSVLPRTDLRHNEGPDFSAYGAEPFLFGPDHALLGIPQTVEMLGALGSRGLTIYRLVNSGWPRTCKVPGILARLGLLDRITLTPEGIRIAEAKRLTRTLVARGHRILVLSYHSPSLCPGNTPYVRDDGDLERFLAWLDSYFEFFCYEIGGQFATVSELHKTLVPSARG